MWRSLLPIRGWKARSSFFAAGTGTSRQSRATQVSNARRLCVDDDLHYIIHSLLRVANDCTKKMAFTSFVAGDFSDAARRARIGRSAGECGLARGELLVRVVLTVPQGNSHAECAESGA